MGEDGEDGAKVLRGLQMTGRRRKKSEAALKFGHYIGQGRWRIEGGGLRKSGGWL